MGPFRNHGVELQERDLDILVSLFECRVMNLAHITSLFFAGKTEAAKKRVQKLKAGGFLRERKRRIGDPSVLHIGTKAFAALRESGKLDRFPATNMSAFEKRGQVSDLTLRHELEVMEVRMAFVRAVRETQHLSILEFTTWPALCQFTARYISPTLGRREALIKPDGFIRIHEKTSEGTFEHIFFLEVDRSTESQEVIAQKAVCYLDFYQSGGMALRLGANPEEFRQFPFRVLMVFKSEERRNNAAQRLWKNNPPILTQVWLSTHSEVFRNPLGQIWIRPSDHMASLRGTECHISDDKKIAISPSDTRG